jgi:DoxX-like family
MNNLDRSMEYLAAGVFLCVGVAKIVSYRRRPKPLGAQSADLPFGLPYGTFLAVGLFQIAAALVLVTPLASLSAIAPWAVAGLLCLTLAGAMYHTRRHESAVPNLALFLLAMFVAVGRWM